MLSAKNDAGQPVDWWFAYKISSESESSKGLKATGGEYVYYDADTAAAGGKLALSSNVMNKKEGTLYSTLSQLYGRSAKGNRSLGFWFYNDENPIKGKPKGKVVSSRGHTKGVVAFDLKSDTGFWLIQSTPLFPPAEGFSFLETGMKMAQTFLCITLHSAHTAMRIAHSMYVAQQPSVYYASKIPKDLPKVDYRALLMQNEIDHGRTKVAIDFPFFSRGMEHFRLMAKNKYWGHDLYNDWVGPRLHQDLKVETWEHGKTPSRAESDGTHRVTAMQSVTLEPNPAYSWSESYDHAKLAISDPDEKVHWVCVGDINFTLAQEKRGGGTVAFKCDPLWKELSRILSAAPEPKRKTASRRKSGRSTASKKRKSTSIRKK